MAPPSLPGLPPVEPARRGLRRQRRLVAAMAALALLALGLPLDALHIPLAHYLPLHTALEFLSIAVACLVFATVWSAPARALSPSLVLIATALFVAGWLDFGHALSLKGMPALVTPASTHKGIGFWLLARLMVAATIALASVWPPAAPGAWRRSTVLAVYAALGLAGAWALVAHEQALPATFVEGVGLTPFKVALEWLVTGLLALAALRYHRLARRGDDEVPPLLFGAAAIAAVGELFFTHYTVANNAQNLIGHVYKIVAYALVYRALFVVTVRQPYRQLAEQARALLAANETLRAQSLALESTATPVVLTDLDGRVRWRNRASAALLPTPTPQAEAALNLFDAPATPEPRQRDELRATLTAGRTWRGLVALPGPQGATRVVDRTVTPVRDEAGAVTGYVAVAEDVTDRLEAVQRHQRVLDTALDGFWVVDAEGRLLEASQAYAQLSGYPVEALVGMHISALEAVEARGEVQAHLARIAASGHERFETRHRHRLGHAYAVEVSVTHDPVARQLYVFIRDISERERAAAQRRDLERQLQQAQ